MFFITYLFILLFGFFYLCFLDPDLSFFIYLFIFKTNLTCTFLLSMSSITVISPFLSQIDLMCHLHNYENFTSCKYFICLKRSAIKLYHCLPFVTTHIIVSQWKKGQHGPKTIYTAFWRGGIWKTLSVWATNMVAACVFLCICVFCGVGQVVVLALRTWTAYPLCACFWKKLMFFDLMQT